MRKNGFTLIELMLSIAAFGTVMLILSSMLGTLYSARIRTQASAEVDQVGGLILSRILLTTKNAKLVNTPTAGTNGAMLNLTVDDVSKTPTVFNLQSDNVQVQEGSSSPIVLGSSKVTASNLVFENLSQAGTPAIIRVQFTITHRNSSGRSEYVVSKTFYGTASLH